MVKSYLLIIVGKSSVNSIVNISAKKSVNTNIDNLPMQMFDDPL